MKIIYAALAGAAAAMLLLVSFPAHSLELKLDGWRVEGSFGEGRYQRSPPGMWWQPDHDNPSAYRDNKSWELGLNYRLNDTFGLSGKLVHIGWAHTRALATTCPQDDCTKRDNTLDRLRADCAKGFSEAGCTYAWDGDGGINHGVNLSLTAKLLKVGPVEFEGEAGALVYKISWSEQVHPIGCAEKACPWRVDIDQKSDWLMSPMIGVTARIDRCLGLLTEKWGCQVATRYYTRTSQHSPVTAGVMGPIQTWLFGISKNF